MQDRENTSLPRENCGEIQLILGPMFSGKTSELLRRIRRHQVRRDVCSLLKTSIENGSRKLITHDKFEFVEAIPCDRLFDHLNTVQEARVVGIDEGQFFPDIIEFADELASQGKTLIIAALDSDYARNPFSNICELVAKAENVVKLSSICALCGSEAAFTARTCTDANIKVIGGRNKSKPACRRCHSNLSSKWQARVLTSSN